VAFVGDADTALIPDFSRAMLKLARLLHPLPLLLPRLPVNAPGKGVDDCRKELNGQFNAWFDSIVGQALTVNPQSTQSALALELLNREVAALKTLSDKSAVTRENALERSVKLALGFYRDMETRQEVERIACDVFGVSCSEFGQLLEAARLRQLDKFKAERQAKGASVTVPALPATIWSGKLPPIENSQDLVNDASLTRPGEIVRGLIHERTKAVLASDPKAGKTWMLLDLALSVATGKHFWGLPTQQGRVLYLNFEVQRFFLKDRLEALCRAKGISDHRALDTWTLRGNAMSFGILVPQILERIKTCNYLLIIVDPIYKALGGRDENSAGAMSELTNELDALSVQSGATVVYAAHFSKGNQAAKNPMDRISGSNVPVRDADSIITLTEHTAPGAYTVETILRNFIKRGRFTVEWAFPLMVPRPDLDPSKLKLANGRKPTFSVTDILPLLQTGPLTTMEWFKVAEKQTGVSKSTFLRFKKEAMNDGKIDSAPDDKWALVSTPAQGATGAKSSI
jgi:hypothetical protein